MDELIIKYLRDIWTETNSIKWNVWIISISLLSIAVTLIARLLIFPLIGLA